ncbi:MAG: hypothetical protein ACREXW_00960 [Gammaproteobacteria bacterium]
MAAAVRATTSIALGNRTNTVFTAPAGLANNDILLAIMTCGDGGDQTVPAVTPPTGFTQLTGFPIAISEADPYAVGLRAFWKLAASESGNYTFTHGAADSEGVMYAISGADATPINPNPSTNTGLGASSVALGLTTPVNGSLVVLATHVWNAAGPTSPPTGTTPTFTERYDPGAGGILYVADGVLATAGATGDKTLTSANGPSHKWGATLICIEAGAAIKRPFLWVIT